MALAELRFTKGDLHSLLAHQGAVVADAIRKLAPDVVLGTPVADLADLLYTQHCVEPLFLDRDRRTSPGAKDLDLSVDSWRGGSVKVDGTRIEVLVPFEGDAILFDVQASHFTYNPPRFDLKNGCVVLAFEGRAPINKDEAKASIDGLLATIEQHIAWQRSDIDPWNDQLKQDLPGQVEARRTKVLQDRELDAFFDVPIVGRPNPSMSFTVDPPKKPLPISGSGPQASTTFVPEPAISDAGFAAILSEIESVTTAVQRLPRSFSTMPEESLRDVLLVVLNNRFGPATGETFSRAGKTDIFIPWGGDQRAVFIAECKWWKGAAAFRRAIDQLLSYTTWRDTRASLIVFVRNGVPTEIHDKAVVEIERHKLFKRRTEIKGRSILTLANRDDPHREIHVALLLVPVL